MGKTQDAAQAAGTGGHGRQGPDASGRSAAGRGTAGSAAEYGGAPALEHALELQLWLAGMLLGLPDAALAGLGLERGAFERELAPHRAQVDNYRKLQATARLMTRSATAELLRCRVNCMALAARTPSELAAIARAVKTLPDWVWADAVQEDGVAPSRPADFGGYGGKGAAATEGGARPADSSAGARGRAPRQDADGDAVPLEEWQAFLPGPGLIDGLAGAPPPAPQLNREQRRALDARLRKGR